MLGVQTRSVLFPIAWPTPGTLNATQEALLFLAWILTSSLPSRMIGEVAWELHPKAQRHKRGSIAWLPDVLGGAGGGPPWQFFARCGEVRERGPARLPRRVDAQGENVR